MNENEISSIIIGEAIAIHRAIDPGLLESAYKECLFYRLRNVGLLVEKEKQIPLTFDEVNLECGYRIDLLIERKVVIEVKSVEALNDIFLAQVMTYLKLGGFKLGLLINFNVTLLKDGVRRVANHI